MKSFLFLALLLFLLPSCGLHQKINCDCSCRCLNRGGNESLGSLSVKFGREIKNNQDSSFFYSKYQMIRFSQNGIYDGISTYKLSQDEIIDKNNLTYWAFRSNSCYRVNDSLIITESHAPLNWNLSYYLYKNDKLIYLYSGRRFFNRCKLYNYEEVMKRAKKNGWNINKAQTYHKVDSSNLVQINELLNYSYAFVFDLKHTITYEEFKEKLIRDFRDRKSTRLNSSHVRISYAVFCLK